MKHIIALLMALVSLTAGGASYLDNISVSPYAAVKHVGITDGAVYGAGLDIGLGINKFVSLHALNTAYTTEEWRGQAIDETALLGRFKLVKNAKETLLLYGLGGGDRDWQTDDWAVGVGLGVELNLSKNVSLSADSRIRAWFRGDREKDLQTRAGINFSF